MKRKSIYPKEYWDFAREVLLEIKKQEVTPYTKYQKMDGIAYNVALMLDKRYHIPIQELGKY